MARSILLEQHSQLGLKRGTSNLLSLGTRLRSHELVAHDLSQGVLDDQWRGRDPRGGRVALKLDNIPPFEVPFKLMLLTLLGWTGIGASIVPIIPNEYSKRSHHHHKRRWWMARCSHGFVTSMNIYRVPCHLHSTSCSLHSA